MSDTEDRIVDKEKAMEAFESSWTNLQDIKDSRKGLKDALKRIQQATSGDKKEIRTAATCLFRHGRGWDGSPIMLAKGAKRPDPLTKCFNTFLNLIISMQDTGHRAELQEYFDALAANGITIELDESRSIEVPEETKEDYVDCKAYIKAIDETSDMISEEDAVTCSDSGLIPVATKYKGLLEIYSKVRGGKEDKADEKIQQGAYEAAVMSNAYTFMVENKKEFTD